MSSDSSPGDMSLTHFTENLMEAINQAAFAVEWVDCVTGRYLKVNDYAASLHNMRVDEMEGMLLWEVDPDYPRERFDEVVAILRREGRFSLESVHKRKRGEVFPVEISISYRGKQDDVPEHFVAFIRDISERKQHQAELTAALEQADKAAQAKSEFLANMSHEIRTPMNGVYGSLQVLLQKVTDPELRPVIQRAILSCRNQLTILNDILDFSKVDAGMLEMESIPFSFTDVANNVIDDLKPAAKKKGITLSATWDSSYEDGFKGDPTRIGQILQNLISNAFKFTDQGSVSIVAGVDKCTQPQTLHFRVIDTGIGMSAEFKRDLFTRFMQADSSTTRRYGGTGLGMAITKSLVDNMKGRIRVTSEEGKGSQFDVSLPLPAATVPQQDRLQRHTLPDLRGRRILVAEDNAINQVVFEAMMQASHAELKFVENGAEAVSAIQEFTPQLVFLDIQMPVMDGIEACKRIKESGYNRRVIALTANVMKQDVASYAQAGFDGYLSKPLELEKLNVILRKAFSK